MTNPYDVTQIENGSLNLQGENAFYNKVKSELLKIMVREHEFNLERLSKGELLRLSTHIENIECHKYHDLNDANEKLILSTKLGLSSEILKRAYSLNSTETVSITIKD